MDSMENFLFIETRNRAIVRVNGDWILRNFVCIRRLNRCLNFKKLIRSQSKWIKNHFARKRNVAHNLQLHQIAIKIHIYKCPKKKSGVPESNHRRYAPGNQSIRLIWFWAFACLKYYRYCSSMNRTLAENCVNIKSAAYFLVLYCIEVDENSNHTLFQFCQFAERYHLQLSSGIIYNVKTKLNIHFSLYHRNNFIDFDSLVSVSNKYAI